MMNFKIRVVENIGAYSYRKFGSPGSILRVIDGVFKDKESSIWTNDGEKYNDPEDINKHFSEKDEWQTLFELVEENRMTKSDLKTGMRVTHRDGESLIVLRGCDFTGCIPSGEEDVIVNFEKKSWSSFTHINDDLTNQCRHSCDIVKVESPSHPFDIFVNANYSTVWTRKEKKLMTIAEIEKILGYTFEIVEEKP
jgi:hypothetical protein